jgi:P4 family phage/plasmid primase-like protien
LEQVSAFIGIRIAAAYDTSATFEVFDQVVTEALRDAEDHELLIRFAGYVLLPHCRLHAALICYGQSGTGKSTVWEAIQNVLGTDLVLNISLRQLCDSKGYSLPRLRFAALNLGTEAPSGELGESDAWKSLICGEPVDVRPCGGRPVKMEAYCTKFVFLSNHLPHFKSGSDAEVRRLRFLQFEHKPAKIDTSIKLKLEAERDGIFSNVMVPGLQALMRDPVMPEGGKASRSVRERFAVENDPIEAFLASCCHLGPDLSETKDRLHRAFLAWSRGKDVGSGLQTSEHFFRQLRARRTGLQDHRPSVDGQRPHCLKGLRLKDGILLAEEPALGEGAGHPGGGE